MQTLRSDQNVKCSQDPYAMANMAVKYASTRRLTSYMNTINVNKQSTSKGGNTNFENNY